MCACEQGTCRGDCPCGCSHTLFAPAYDASDWKPGDYMLARVIRWPNAAEWPADTSRVLLRLDEDGSYWNAVEGDPSDPFCMHVNTTPEYLHPLVVIDPEDAEQVERLAKLLWPHYSEVESARLCKTEITADALREFANPTPRIEEPTGLGAVVEDEDGRLWVRSPADDYPWNTAHRAATGIITAPWSEVNAVHVLSPGLPS